MSSLREVDLGKEAELFNCCFLILGPFLQVLLKSWLQNFPKCQLRSVEPRWVVCPAIKLLVVIKGKFGRFSVAYCGLEALLECQYARVI